MVVDNIRVGIGGHGLEGMIVCRSGVGEQNADRRDK